MAWGYWSATTVDRGRSPRRNTGVNSVPTQQQQQQYYQQPQQNHQGQSSQQAANCNSCNDAVHTSQNNVCHSPCQSPCQQSPCGSPCRSPCRSEKYDCRSVGCRSQCHSPEFEVAAPPPPQVIQCTYSRRQSLDSPQVSLFYIYRVLSPI